MAKKKAARKVAKRKTTKAKAKAKPTKAKKSRKLTPKKKVQTDLRADPAKNVTAGPVFREDYVRPNTATVSPSIAT